MSDVSDNINFLSPLGFRFVIKKLPNVSYFSQSVEIPALSLPAISVTNPLARIQFSGAPLDYSNLNLEFRVDEDLKNYLEIHNWLVGMGHPVSLDQTRQLSQDSATPFLKVGQAASYVSDATLMILTSHKNPNLSVTFRDLFPISLSSLRFDSTETDVNYLSASVSFSYLRFDIETA